MVAMKSASEFKSAWDKVGTPLVCVIILKSIRVIGNSYDVIYTNHTYIVRMFRVIKGEKFMIATFPLRAVRDFEPAYYDLFKLGGKNAQRGPKKDK